MTRAPQRPSHSIRGGPAYTLGMPHRLVLLLALFVGGTALAHVPLFPEGPGPFEVPDPTVSKAYYLWLEPGESHVFVVPPLGRTIPVQVLVLDDERGRSQQHRARVDCGDAVRSLRRVDTPFFEGFSRIEHRYRIVDAIGPSDVPCRVEVTQTGGAGGPYTFSIGEEERFSVGDLVGLIGLGARLAAWREGP
jgi:hypothetical protein